MKKLMIAAAAAAMVGGAYADGDPQVYDMTITVKSTECVNKSYKNVCGEGVGYRKQVTTKFYGKFWGCGCCTIAEPDGNVGYGQDLADGAYDTDFHSYIFWGKDAAFHDATMTWGPAIDSVQLANLQLVGPKATNIEGAFKLELFTCENGQANVDPSAVFFGAGYGTATVKGCPDDSNILKSMSGNVIGTYDVGQLSGINGCKYCGEATACAPWDFCSCSQADDTLTAAFGSFTIKYNASQAASLKKGKYISELMKKNKAVIAEFACIANGGSGDMGVVDSLEEAYKTALKNYIAATNELAEAKKVYDNNAFVEGNSADYIAITNALVTTKKAEAESKTAKDKAVEKLGTVKDAFNDYASAKVDLLKAEQVYAQLNKYGTAAKVKAFKDDALKKTQEAVDGNDKTVDKYGIYTNAVAEATIGGKDAAEAKKNIEAAEKALATYLDDLKASYDAYDAVNLWDGMYFDAVDKIASFASGVKDDGTYTKSTETEISADAGELKKIEGTKEYAEAEAKANTTAKQEAVTAAQTKLQTATIACQVAGGDCE